MKDLLLGLTTAVAIAATLEATGVTDFINGCPGYCDNSKREEDRTALDGGRGIDEATTVNLMTEARRTIETSGFPIKREYFISKAALEDLLTKDMTSTGVFIAPYFDNGRINLLVSNGHWKNTGIENPGSFAYVIKTFCPDVCEMTNVVVTGTPDPGADTTATDTSGH